MNYTEFKNQYQHLPLITTTDIVHSSSEVQVLRNQLSRWQKKGLIERLRKGVFVFNQADRKKSPNIFYIANRLYEPSYVSLEFALNYYGIIPEKVTVVTSVSTRKTMRFTNDFGHFIYQHVKPYAFRGFTQHQDESLKYFMALPEKAVIDFFYLNLSVFNKNIKDVILNSYRFQNFENLSKARLLEFGGLFKTKKLNKVIKSFCELINEHSGEKEAV